MGNYASFHGRCVDWLRGERSLRTAILPENKLCEQPDELVRVSGFFPRPSAAGSWALVGLSALVLGTILTGFGEGGSLGLGESAAARQAVGHGAQFVLVFAAVCMVIAEAQRRRHRLHATVELRSKQAEPVTPTTVEDLRRGAPLGAAWVLSELELTPESLTRAAQLGVRCFVERGARFEERSVFLAAQEGDKGRSAKHGSGRGLTRAG